ncbi:MAG: hypothetical protein WC989_06070 [Micavibrio sp.]
MLTHAKLGSQLLRDAATFFRTIGQQNPPIGDQMEENARIFEQVADLLEQDPTGIVPSE